MSYYLKKTSSFYVLKIQKVGGMIDGIETDYPIIYKSAFDEEGDKIGEIQYDVDGRLYL